MKNFTLLFFLVLLAIKGHGQCNRTYEPSAVTSNNSGFVQELSTCSWTTTDIVTVANLIVGSDYIFTCSMGETMNYITVTDANNVVLEAGYSPLTVSAVAYSTLKLYLSDDENCAGSQGCHIVTAQLQLACPFPTGLVMEDLTTTSANFYWEATGSETTWEVIALPASSPAPADDLTEGVATVNDSPEYAATLLPATTYKFYYRAVCSPTEKSPWVSSAAFSTLCEDVTYFSEGFDNASSLPNCFLKVGETGSVNVQNETTSASLPNNLYMSSGGVLSLPSVSNFADNTHRIKFKLRGAYSAGGSVEFGFLGEPGVASSFVVLETFLANSSTVYDEYAYEPGDAPETGTLAFRHVASNNNSIVLDDIIWEAVPACPDVTLLKIDTYTSDSAVLSWSSEESSWEVVYGPAATTSNPNDLTPQTVEEASVALADLAPSTAYKVWVRSNCEGGTFGAWIGPRTVTTTCAPVANFSENFNASSSIPACFKRVGNGGNAYIQSSSIYLSSYDNGDGMSYGTLALPAVNNAAAGTHRLKFSIKSPNSTGGVIELGYLTNPDNGASFTAVQSFTSTSTTAQTVIYIPAAGAITAEVMAFRHTGVPSSAVLIDDLIWETAPACGDVTAIQSSEVSNASAKITWTGTTETNWEVAYGATSVTDPSTLTAVAVSDEASTVLVELEASTTYKVWVRSNCGTAGFGAWIGPIQFTTSCDAVTSFTQGFDASSSLPNCWTQVGGIFVQSGGAASAPNSLYVSAFNVLATPPVSNAAAGTHRLKFKAKSTYTLGGVIEVGYLTSYNDATTFVSLQSFTPTSTATYDEFFANLGTVPTTGYLALKHSGSSWNAVSIDDVVWEPLPSCEAVSNLTVDMVTNTTATVSWTAVTSTAWEIAYTDSDITPITDLTPTQVEEAQFAFETLDANTTYRFWVRAVCGNDEFGSWIGPKEFTTTCDPIADLPWEEDFESVSFPNLPTCWTEGNGNWELTDSADSFSKPYSGAQYIRVYNGVQNGYMWTPGFTLEANQAYDFSAFVQGDSYDGWSVAMVYNNQPTAQGATQLGELYEVAAGTGVQEYQEMERTFVPTVSGTYFFAVKVNENSTGSPYYLAFDYFTLEAGDLSNPTFGANAFTAYPNPVKDVLNLSYTENIKDVMVFNLLGQQVMSKAINAHKGQVDLSNLSAGNYLVKITADNQVKTMKIVKE